MSEMSIAWSQNVGRLLEISSLDLPSILRLRLYFAESALPPIVGESRRGTVERLLREASRAADPFEALKDLYLAALEHGAKDHTLREFTERALFHATDRHPQLQSLAEFRLRWAAVPYSTANNDPASRQVLIRDLLSEAEHCLHEEVYVHALLDMIKTCLHG